MRWLCICYCAVFFGLNGVFCEEKPKNSTFHFTSTRDGTCVKVYYSEDDFYKIHCFQQLTNSTSIGLKTDRNDVLIYKGYGENSECFEIQKSNSENRTLLCLVELPENCIEDKAEEKFRSKIEEVNCTKNSTMNYLGVSFENLNVVFRCVVYSVQVPSEDGNVRARYCHNRPIKEQKIKYKLPNFNNMVMKLLHIEN